MQKFIALKPFNNKVFYKNAVFDERNQTGSHYLIAARKLLAKKNIILSTIDILTTTQKDVYTDVPYPWELKLWIRIIINRSKNILFIVEPPIVNPFNFIKIFHLFFSKIYTWNDSFVDNIKYFKYLLPKTNTGINTKKVPFKDKKLLVLMNGNLSPFLPFRLLSLSTKQLYTERIKAINFFDKNHSESFYLYGRGWNKPQKFNIKQRLFGYKKYKTYKGQFPQKDKYRILSKFKFCLCFENSATIGYISEKIIDCFKARCIPIYLGAPNITDHINNHCFIDFRKFKNYEELFKFLGSIDEKKYNSYLKAIDKFLLGKQFTKQWSSEAFAKIFLEAVSG